MDVNNTAPSGHQLRSSRLPPFRMPSSWVPLSRIEESRKTNTDRELRWTRYHEPILAALLSSPSTATVKRLCSGRWVFACLNHYVCPSHQYLDLHQLLYHQRVPRHLTHASISCHPPTSAIPHPVHTTAQMLSANRRIPLPRRPQAKVCLSSM
jgi:hypothetical protein